VPNEKNKKRLGNIYDRIFRENIQPIFIPFIERYLKIEITEIKPLPDKMVTSVERETDALYKVKTSNNSVFILHLQVQTRDDTSMIYRVVELHGILLRKYKLPLRHVVLYLGEKPSKMKANLSTEEAFTGFELLSMREMSAAKLLQSEIPEEVILAILADFDKTKSDALIRSIIQRLQLICKNKKSLRKYANQLTILSKLRNLEGETIKNIKIMPQLFDITTSILYKQGLEQGLEQGQEQLEQSLEKKLLILIANMLTKSSLPLNQVSDLSGASIKKVSLVKENLGTQKWSHPDSWTDEMWNDYFKTNGAG